MPIYEYQCSACQHRLEKLQKISDEPLQECPNCKQSTLEKLISAAGFQLKGSGWYVTDFRDKDKKPANSDKPTSSENSASSDKTASSKESSSTAETPKTDDKKETTATVKKETQSTSTAKGPVDG